MENADTSKPQIHTTAFKARKLLNACTFLSHAIIEPKFAIDVLARIIDQIPDHVPGILIDGTTFQSWGGVNSFGYADIFREQVEENIPNRHHKRFYLGLIRAAEEVKDRLKSFQDMQFLTVYAEANTLGVKLLSELDTEIGYLVLLNPNHEIAQSYLGSMKYNPDTYLPILPPGTEPVDYNFPFNYYNPWADIQNGKRIETKIMTIVDDAQILLLRNKPEPYCHQAEGNFEAFVEELTQHPEQITQFIRTISEVIVRFEGQNQLYSIKLPKGAKVVYKMPYNFSSKKILTFREKPTTTIGLILNCPDYPELEGIIISPPFTNDQNWYTNSGGYHIPQELPHAKAILARQNSRGLEWLQKIRYKLSYPILVK